MKIVAFDLDKTLLTSNSSYEFCLYLYRKKAISWIQLLSCIKYRIQHQYFSLPIEELHHKVFEKLLLGMSLNNLRDDASSFLEKMLPSSFYLPALCALFEAQKKGDYTLILSNSPDFIVRYIAEILQVDEWASSQYVVDKDMRLCKIAKIMEGRSKAAYLIELARRLQLTKADIVAYSDSYNDLPFLLESGCPVVVNPDRKLLKVARASNWSVI